MGKCGPACFAIWCFGFGVPRTGHGEDISRLCPGLEVRKEPKDMPLYTRCWGSGGWRGSRQSLLHQLFPHRDLLWSTCLWRSYEDDNDPRSGCEEPLWLSGGWESLHDGEEVADQCEECAADSDATPDSLGSHDPDACWQFDKEWHEVARADEVVDGLPNSATTWRSQQKAAERTKEQRPVKISSCEALWSF